MKPTTINLPMSQEERMRLMTEVNTIRNIVLNDALEVLADYTANMDNLINLIAKERLRVENIAKRSATKTDVDDGTFVIKDFDIVQAYCEADIPEMIGQVVISFLDNAEDPELDMRAIKEKAKSYYEKNEHLASCPVELEFSNKTLIALVVLEASQTEDVTKEYFNLILKNEADNKLQELRQRLTDGLKAFLQKQD